MDNTNKSAITFIDLLQIAFIILKLTNVITWSWPWVLSPLWISILLIIIFTVIHTIKSIRRE